MKENKTEEEERFLPHSSDIITPVITPDDVLEKLGPRNPFLITTILLTGLIWTMTSMNGLSATFVARSCLNCTDAISLNDEFELQGDRAWQADMTTTAFMFGNMVGGTVLSEAGDRYGRRPVMLLCMLMMSLTGVIGAFAPSPMVFAVARFLQGIFYTSFYTRTLVSCIRLLVHCKSSRDPSLQGGSLVCWVLGYESTPIQLRFFTTVYFGMCWVLGICLLSPIAYLAPDWRQLILFVSVPYSVLAAFCFFFVPESLHFLVSSGSPEVEEWLNRATKYSKDEGFEKFQPDSIVHSGNPEKTGSLFVELWKHKIFIVYTAILVYVWICDTFIYFGLSLYSTSLAGNIYLNFLMMGLVELPAYILCPIAMDRFGRRCVCFLTHITAAATFFGLLFSSANGWLTTILWLCGKFLSSCSFMSIYVYGSEIFPTNIRNLSIGFCETMSRIGGILAPYVATLGRWNASLPMIVLAVISLTGGLLTMFLPETLNKKLPSTIEEAVKKH